MKRITYISKLSVDSSEVKKIAEISSNNNLNVNITGILLHLSGFFFQIIEGEAEQVELLVILKKVVVYNIMQIYQGKNYELPNK